MKGAGRGLEFKKAKRTTSAPHLSRSSVGAEVNGNIEKGESGGRPTTCGMIHLQLHRSDRIHN